MKALILAAGYATRLYPLTKEYPKSLLTVGEKPIIDYIIDKFQALDGLNEIIVVTNSKFIALFKKWADKQKGKKRISLVDDLTDSHAKRRGAIGDMDFAINRRRIRDDLLVIGGDNLFNRDLSDFLSFARAKQDNPVIGAYDIKDARKAKKYGLVKLDRKNKIIDFQEKPKTPKSTLVAMCLYYFPKERLRLIREYLNNTHKYDTAGFYIDWLRKKIPVYGFVFDGLWYDIGDRKFYKEANRRFKVNKLQRQSN